MDFTAEMAQRKLAKMDDSALVSHFADVAIAVALRRGVSPQQVHREAEKAFGWSEQTWEDTIAPHIREVLANAREGAT